MQTIVVTGCSTGFGRVTAFYLAERGWRVVATVRQQAQRQELSAQAAARGLADRLLPVVCDITQSADVERLKEFVAQAAPDLQALLNNAGTAYAGPLELLALDDVRAQLEVNLLAHFGVKVVVVAPGASPTAIWDTALRRARGSAMYSDLGSYAPLAAAIEQRARQSAASGFPPVLFARTVWKILNSRQPAAIYCVPRAAGWLVAGRRLLPDTLWEWGVRRILRW